MKKTLTASIFILSIFFVSCNETSLTNTMNSETVEIKDVQKESETEDFQTFYQQFISDISFQMERIHFPVDGKYYSEDETYTWSKNNWLPIIKDVKNIDTNELKVEITKTDEKVTHFVYIPNSGFSVKYSFELIDGKWFLTQRTDSNF